MRGGIVRLEADINFIGMTSPYSENTIYFEVDEANEDMLADDTYDAFVLVPLYLAMFHKQDLHICGKISKKFHQNLKWYIQKILSDFSEYLSPVNFTVEGFVQNKPKGNLIGAPISCGVDSLSTIYDHFFKCDDPDDYRINALFLFNCGSHGTFKDKFTFSTFLTRVVKSASAAKELGLPIYWVNTNLHAFWHEDSTWRKFKRGHDYSHQMYLASYSCILSLQNAIFRYYMPSTYDYSQIKNFEEETHDSDLAEFCESYFVPLIQTERTELIADGCQYRRVDKLKKIVDWDIAQKYLDVCWRNTPNCGICDKCLRTLLPLEILGKLDKFSRVFNIEQYKENSFGYKIHCLQSYGKKAYETENVDFAKENNFPMPTKRDVYILSEQAVII